MVCFWENFIKQKFYIATNLRGGRGQVRLGAGPPPGTRLPVQVQGEGLLPWSFGRFGQFLAHGHSDVLDPGPQPPGSKCTLSQSVSHNNIFGCIVIFCLPDPWLGSQDCREHRMRAPVELLPGKKTGIAYYSIFKFAPSNDNFKKCLPKAAGSAL